MKDTFVLYCKDQINSDIENVPETAIFGIFKVSEDLHGKKRVLKFMSKVLKLLELRTMSDDIEIINEVDFEEDICCEIDYYVLVIRSGGMEETYQIQKLFKH